MQKCLTYFGKLTDAQQLQAASQLQRRITPAIRNPSAFLTKIIATVESTSSISGTTSAISPAKSPSTPARPKSRLNAHHISGPLILDNLSPVGTGPCSSDRNIKSHSPPSIR